MLVVIAMWFQTNLNVSVRSVNKQTPVCSITSWILVEAEFPTVACPLPLPPRWRRARCKGANQGQRAPGSRGRAPGQGSGAKTPEAESFSLVMDTQGKWRISYNFLILRLICSAKKGLNYMYTMLW